MKYEIYEVCEHCKTNICHFLFNSECYWVSFGDTENVNYQKFICSHYSYCISPKNVISIVNILN